MKKIVLFKRIIVSFVTLSLVISLFMTPSASAGYADNASALYYHLADQVYKVDGTSTGKQAVQSKLNTEFGWGRYTVIDTVDSTNYYVLHPMAKLTNGGQDFLDNTGLQAMAVVGDGKLFIAVAGTNPTDLSDLLTSKNIIESDTPGQLYQIQLYLNYLYTEYPGYRGYNWYITGHSLGGYLAAKTYLDIRAANWLNSSTRWVYGGAVKKSLSGVYTFNPLTIPKHQVSLTQWNANINGTYNSDIKNHYIENEWLNGVYDMHTSEMAYFGSRVSVNTGVPHYTSIGYPKSSSIIENLVEYYAYSRIYKKIVSDSHNISTLSPYVFK